MALPPLENKNRRIPRNLGELLMLITFILRKNPMRLLYGDWLLKKFQDPAEMFFFEKNWDGIIWDVGASIGKYTTVLAAHNPDHMVYAFEPNLNSLDYLAYRCSRYDNITLVPNALTLDGASMKGSHDPHFNADPTGPMVPTMALAEAITKFGLPAFVKIDIEGAEYGMFENPPEELFNSSLLVSWHPHLTGLPVPDLDKWWNVKKIADDLTFLTPIDSD